MAEFSFTPSQRAAIFERGRSLLVSAAAGSGKTRVLTERLLAYVTDGDDPRDIDSFLVITFTRAAAAELKSRIIDELSARRAKNPADRRLRRQADLCYRAKIGTIDSYCAELVRENCAAVGYAPDFRVLEDARGETMKLRCAEAVLDAAYGRISEDPGFRALTDTAGAGRDDSRLRDILLSLHGRMQSHAFPRDWALEQKRLMELGGVEDPAGTPWGRWLLDWTGRAAAGWAEDMEALLSLMRADAAANEKIIKAYCPSIAETAAALRDLSRACGESWEAARARVPVPFPRLGPLRGFEDAGLQNSVKSRRETCKKALSALEKHLAIPGETLLRDQRAAAPAMEALLDLTLAFDEALSREKRRVGVVEFADLEHFAAELLWDRRAETPTALARELSGRFTEIMVDEYQDVNAVQELLFRALSRDGTNLFFVGDVKQAIYRFRLADPGIFLRRYAAWADLDSAEPGEGARIFLRENFRSRGGVIDAANHVFTSLMSRELGEIDYDENARLCGRADYPDGGAAAELCLIRLPEGGGEDEESPDRLHTEADWAAARIRSLVDGGATVYESGRERPLRWGDCAILLRSPGSAGGAFRSALLRAGVPVASAQGGGFFETPEITVAVSLLSVVDNPRQDLPLISVLRSAIFGFTPDELTHVRLCAREGDFWDALLLAAEQDARCRRAVEGIGYLRARAPELTTDALLRLIYSRTGLADMADTLAAANLTALLEYARRFEAEGARGLFRFVAWLRKLSERGEEPPVAAPDSDAVLITSIHKSKGLEFPVVLLCDTARRFNTADEREGVLVHGELGLGPWVTDAERALEYPSLARLAIKTRMREEALSEEMRLLYVALTRARERLIVSLALREPEAAMEKYRAGTRPSPAALARDSSPGQWLLRAALLPESPIRVLTAEPPTAESAAARGHFEPLPQPSPELLREAEARLGYVYPHAWASPLPSKLTVTEVKNLPPSGEDGEAARLIKSEPPAFRLPELGGGGERPLTGAERGTATHLALRHISLAHAGSAEDIAGDIAALAARGLLSAREAGAVDCEALHRFFSSPLGRELRAAPFVRREFPFSLLCGAERFWDVPPGESVLLQGVVDCFFGGEDGPLTLLDYKTDYVTRETLAESAARYRPQLLAYADALRRITRRPVTRAALIYLRPGLQVPVEI